MKRRQETVSGSSGECKVTAGLYAMELFALILLLSLYRLEGKPGLSSFLVSVPGIASMVSVGAIGLSAALVMRECR
ncbi:MAG TPA: hypothetical protein VLA99_04495, partial [Nitrospiraceae bacterium]|nr:hypothetical protein [Nitrospiraceae bacterium]